MSMVAVENDYRNILATLAESIGPRKFEIWFAQATLIRADQQLLLTVPNQRIGQWVETHYQQQIEQLCRQLTGQSLTLDILIQQTDAPTRPTHHHGQEQRLDKNNATKRPRQLSSLRYDLKEYVVGPFNALAFSSAQSLINDPNSIIRSMFVHGPSGVGKTHLLQGLCRRFAENHPSAKWLYLTAEQFTNQFITALRNNRLTELRNKWRKLDLLVIDDVQFLSGKQSTQQELQHTLDAISISGARMIMAADCAPTQVQNCSQALISRFVGSLIVGIDLPDAESRKQIARNIAERMNLQLEPVVMQMLTDKFNQSIRELEGAMIRLSAIARLIQPQQATPTATRMIYEQAFNHTANAAPIRPIRMNDILQAVHQIMLVDRHLLVSKSRARHVVLARSLAIHLARKLTTLSYPEIARQLGRASHSSMITADKRITQRLKDNPPVPPAPATNAIPVQDLLLRLEQAVRQLAG